MRRTTFFINSLSSGGAEHQLTVLANELVDQGYKVSITTFGDIPDHYPLKQDINRIRIAPNKSNFIKLLAIWIYFLTVKTDCVISFCQRNSYYVLPVLLLRPRLKVICGERNFTCGPQTRIEKILFKFLYKRADFIVPNSYSQKDYIISKCPNYSSKVITITNFTDPDKYSFADMPMGEVVKIGIFCRYEEQKNCVGFINALAEVRKLTKLPFKVDWYGSKKLDNPKLKEYFMKVESVVTELKLEDVLTLNDAVRNVEDKMKDYDAICLPSLFEGFSNSISEAICCGRPMLVSNVSDNHILVKQGINGYLFNPLDINSMVHAIVQFVELPKDKKTAMGINSRKIAESIFNKYDFVDSYMKIIDA